MSVLTKQSFRFLFLILLPISPFTKAMTGTMVATSDLSGYQTMMINTLLLGATVSLPGIQRLDREYFQDQTPEFPDLKSDLEQEYIPLRQWLLEKLLENHDMTEADMAELLIREHRAEAGMGDVVASGSSEITVSPTGQTITVPGMHKYGGGDSDKSQDVSSNEQSDDKDDEKEEKTSDDDTGSASAASLPTSSSLQVLDETLRSQVTTALELYHKKEDCTELEGGGYSRIYTVTEEGVTLVIKSPCMRPEECFKSEKKFQEEKRLLVNMSRNEKDMLLQLKHKNIVKLVAYAGIELPETGTTFLLVLEYAGKNLRYYLKHKNQAIKNHLLFIARNIAEGLSYLHAQGLVWGELKSDNVMVRIHNHQISIRLIDMATCQSPEQRRSLMFDHVFSPGWQAPELYPYVVGMVVTQSSDVYALGLIFAMLGGIHRHSDHVVRQDFKKSRRKQPENVHPLLLSILEDQIKITLELTDDQLSRSGTLEDQTIEWLKTDKSFLHLMAILATRVSEWRPAMDVITGYFDVFRQRPE